MKSQPLTGPKKPEKPDFAALLATAQFPVSPVPEPVPPAESNLLAESALLVESMRYTGEKLADMPLPVRPATPKPPAEGRSPPETSPQPERSPLPADMQPVIENFDKYFQELEEISKKENLSAEAYHNFSKRARMDLIARLEQAQHEGKLSESYGFVPKSMRKMEAYDDKIQAKDPVALGEQTEFRKLVESDPVIGPPMARFLKETAELKAQKEAGKITDEEIAKKLTPIVEQTMGEFIKDPDKLFDFFRKNKENALVKKSGMAEMVEGYDKAMEEIRKLQVQSDKDHAERKARYAKEDAERDARYAKEDAELRQHTEQRVKQSEEQQAKHQAEEAAKQKEKAEKEARDLADQDKNEKKLTDSMRETAEARRANAPKIEIDEKGIQAFLDKNKKDNPHPEVPPVPPPVFQGHGLDGKGLKPVVATGLNK